MTSLSRSKIVAALKRLGKLAQEASFELEMCIFGGAAMMLAFDRRAVTKDVDAIFHPIEKTKPLIRQVAQEQRLPEDWLNNDVVQFLAPIQQTRSLPIDFPGIKITVPTASYLLAMKALASRRALPGYQGDEADLRLLIQKMGIRSTQEVQAHIDRYYPDDVLTDQAQAMISKIIEQASTP